MLNWGQSCDCDIATDEVNLCLYSSEKSRPLRKQVLADLVDVQIPAHIFWVHYVCSKETVLCFHR